ncbi:TetR/AcrR family transcriptional regulator [Mesorhizobium loti]|uniref:TetR/AcrR family transcriptional regulator n=1 Tax=Rhizobium loti TaxID=381 RepID=UPI001929C0DF|nr:TetR family transcriptional regulator [Mesorhizobium loti]
MKPGEFQRARRPEQKEERRSHLLNVTRTLLSEQPGAVVFGLNELARHAGMTKSNVYRYFESREALLMEVLREEAALWYNDLRSDLGTSNEPVSAERLADAIARTASARPLLGHLTSILPSIIEHNVSAECIRDFKTGSLLLIQECASLLHGRTRSLSLSACEEFMHWTLIMITGLWPLSHPSSVANVALQTTELMPFRYDFERDLKRGLRLLLRGLSEETARPGHLGFDP